MVRVREGGPSVKNRSMEEQFTVHKRLESSQFQRKKKKKKGGEGGGFVT
jgi:hypothetical protein